MTQKLPQNKVTSVAISHQTWSGQCASHDGAGGLGRRHHGPPPSYTHTSIQEQLQLVNSQIDNGHRQSALHRATLPDATTIKQKKWCFQAFMLSMQYFSGMLAFCCQLTISPQAFLHCGNTSLWFPLHKPPTSETLIVFPVFLASNHPIQPEYTGSRFRGEPTKKKKQPKKPTLPPLKMYTCIFNALIINCCKT